MKFSEFVAANGKPARIEPGEHVFRQGDRDRCIYLLHEGLLKAYYLSDEGRETIKSFVLPGETISSLSSAYKKSGCTFNLVALQPSALIGIEFDALDAISRTDLEMASAVMDLLLEFALKKERREREFLTESAEHRYRLLIERSPELEAKVKQKDIARYLGITPVALSRIRARHGNGGR
jgi:CRP-like cAMP-binding protein